MAYPIALCDIVSYHVVTQFSLCDIHACRYSAIVERFMALDLETASDDEIQAFLKNSVLTPAEGLL